MVLILGKQKGKQTRKKKKEKKGWEFKFRDDDKKSTLNDDLSNEGQ